MSWKGVKKQSLKTDIEAWCEEMGIRNYTVNDKGEIDVDGNIDLRKKDFKELPYKFGNVSGWFNLFNNKNITSLKNCPNYIGGSFSCSRNPKLGSLEGCPKEVGSDFWCVCCKREFTEKEVRSLCKVSNNIYTT